jgi:hypothetical protein
LVPESAARQTRLSGGKENAMGINEIDHTIYPYTVGREDCKVLPRSFKKLAEAEARSSKQDTWPRLPPGDE